MKYAYLLQRLSAAFSITLCAMDADNPDHGGEILHEDYSRSRH